MGSEQVDTRWVNTGQDGQMPDARVPNGTGTGKRRTGECREREEREEREEWEEREEREEREETGRR